MATKVSVDHDGKTYDGQIGTISSTRLGYEDHGIFSAYLTVTGTGWGVSVGGYALDQYVKAEDQRIGSAYGLDHVIRILETVGVSSWEKLVGQQVVVLYGAGDAGWGGRSVGIAGTTNDKVLILADHAQAWKDREAVAA